MSESDDLESGQTEFFFCIQLTFNYISLFLCVYSIHITRIMYFTAIVSGKAKSERDSFRRKYDCKIFTKDKYETLCTVRHELRGHTFVLAFNHVQMYDLISHALV